MTVLTNASSDYTHQTDDEEINPFNPADSFDPKREDDKPATIEPSLEEKIVFLKDQWMRSVADFENAQKRMTREKEEIQKFAVSNIAKDLLSVLDNLYRALDNIPMSEGENPIRKGVELVIKELEKIFERHKIQKIDAANSKFDPNFHQAICEINSDVPIGCVVQVFQEGYTIHGRLLRPAMVSVSKGATELST